MMAWRSSWRRGQSPPPIIREDPGAGRARRGLAKNGTGQLFDPGLEPASPVFL